MDMKVQLPPLEPVPTMAERTAERLREHIFQGQLLPGTPLPEVKLAEAFQVSRNTVREAFRVLINENLLAYAMHRGVYVRQLTPEDVHDIYASRRELEFAALESFDHSTPADLRPLATWVEESERAASDERWSEVGTANARFHEAIVAFLGSPRRRRFFRALMTELRLGFCAVADPRAMHGPYVSWNRQILAMLVDGQPAEARQELERYLSEADRQVSEAVR
jgi:DNA-binding GntR family transcriptional regulator